MLKTDNHRLDLFFQIMRPIINSDPIRFKKIIKQLGTIQQSFEIVSPYTGFAFVPILEYKEKGTNKILSGIRLLNKKGNAKELVLYLTDDYLSGFEIKENLENLIIDSLDFSKLKEKNQLINKYFIRYIDLEGLTESIPNLQKYLDAEYLSEEYLIQNKTFYRIIQFDEIRCICVDSKNAVFKVNLKSGVNKKLFSNLNSFYQELKNNELFVYKLFGEIAY